MSLLQDKRRPQGTRQDRPIRRLPETPLTFFQISRKYAVVGVVELVRLR